MDIIVEDKVLEALARAEDLGLGGEVLEVVARAARNVVVDHLVKLDGERANKKGWPRSHFFADAARATNHHVQGDEAVVSIDHLGLAGVFKGGLREPQNGAANLAIPAHPDVYGLPAKDAIEAGYQVGVFFWGRPQHGKAHGAIDDAHTGEILYWLVRSVTIDPDPSVVPEEADYSVPIRRAVEDYFDAALANLEA